MEERGLCHRQMSFVTSSVPKHEHKAAVDPAQSIPELGVPNALFWKELEIHLEEHKNRAQLSLLCVRGPAFQ